MNESFKGKVLIVDTDGPGPLALARSLAREVGPQASDDVVVVEATPRKPHVNVGVIGLSHNMQTSLALLALTSPRPACEAEPSVIIIDSICDDIPCIDLDEPAPRPRLVPAYNPPVRINPKAAQHAMERIATANAKRMRRGARRT